MTPTNDVLNEEFLPNTPVTQDELANLPEDDGFENGEYCPHCKDNGKYNYVGYNGIRAEKLNCVLGHKF